MAEHYWKGCHVIMLKKMPGWSDGWMAGEMVTDMVGSLNMKNQPNSRK